jgi:hypothetical protein
LHGGCSLYSIAHPNFKHGRRSKYGVFAELELAAQDRHYRRYVRYLKQCAAADAAKR